MGKKPRLLFAQSMNSKNELSRISCYIQPWCQAIYSKDKIVYYDQAANNGHIYDFGTTSTYRINTINDNGDVIFTKFTNFPIVKIWVMF